MSTDKRAPTNQKWSQPNIRSFLPMYPMIAPTESPFQNEHTWQTTSTKVLLIEESEVVSSDWEKILQLKWVKTSQHNLN